MGKTARSLLRKNIKDGIKGTRVAFLEEKEKYSKLQFVRVYKGYDFLENLHTVRSYIQKRYDIDLDTLELLLKLMGLRLFTQADFMWVPKKFGNSRFTTFKKKGFLTLVADHRKSAKRIWGLNMKGKAIVTHFYKCLSGEEKISEDPALNPMFNDKKQVAFDKKKMAIIKELNRTPPPEHFKKLFK